MPALAKKNDHISVDDYLDGEKSSEVKHEYVEGLVYAMAGASVKHNMITANVIGALWGSLRGADCFPLSSDMLLKTADDHYRYPDVMVVCDDDISSDEYIRESPVLIMEVLSKSTRKKDKTEKREEYFTIPSLQEYILIEQDFSEIDVQRRSNNWQSSYYFLGDEITLESVDVTLSVEDIYQRVNNEDIQVFLEQKKHLSGEAQSEENT